ncbi:TerD family protein [Vibrio splendidus]|nr:TerD family protein [Vibrio splendidus]MCC4883094.1 TerD family protein [Vibrio splendidus]
MQTINMSKGQRIDLRKADNTPMTHLYLGLGWDARLSEGEKFDADILVMLSDKDGKNLGVENFVFYGNTAKASTCGSVKISADNQTGEGDGDDEFATIDLLTMNPDVDRISLAVNIHEAAARGQNFGIIENAGIRVCEGVVADGREHAKYDLTEDYHQYTAVLVGEVYRNNGEWKFVAKGEGLAGGLDEFLGRFGFVAG